MNLKAEVLVVIEWARFQHYKDRDPSWVKLYRDILTSEAWVVGTDLSRLVQVAITLLAARYQNKIPYRLGLIKKVASLDCSEAQLAKAIAHLKAARFLDILAQNDSDVLAGNYQDATLEESREEKRRGEEIHRPPLASSPKRKSAKTPLPEDFTLTPELEQYAVEQLPHVDPTGLMESFRGKAQAKGWVYANWRQAFQEFIRNASPKSGHFAAGQYPRKGGNGVSWD